MVKQRLGSKGHTIIRILRKQIANQALCVKRHLKKLFFVDDFELDRDNRLFAGQSLRLNYRVLWSKSRALHRMEEIFAYYI